MTRHPQSYGTKYPDIRPFFVNGCVHYFGKFRIQTTKKGFEHQIKTECGWQFFTFTVKRPDNKAHYLRGMETAQTVSDAYVFLIAMFLNLHSKILYSIKATDYNDSSSEFKFHIPTES